MSFFKRIVENKVLAGALALGAIVVAGSVYLYNSYSNDGQEPIPVQDQLDIQKQIEGLKTQVNTVNPSLEDVKRILQFSMNIAKKKIFAYSREFKKTRQQYRIKDMKQYMDIISNGMSEVRNIATNTQTDIMKEMGLNEKVFIKYQSQLGMFMQELMMRQQQNTGSKQLTLEEVKFAIRLQIQFIKNQGQKVLDQMIEATNSWPANRKSQLPLLFSLVVSDGAFENYPSIDQQALQAAQAQMQHHLMKELQQLQQVMTPLLTKLGNFGGLGGFGGMEGMGGFGEEGGDPYGQLTVEQMQQIQQLQRLRLEDPAAFQRLMQGMYR